MHKLLILAVLAIAGCNCSRQEPSAQSARGPSLFLGGDLVFENGGWVEKLYIENHSNSDVVVGDTFIGRFTFSGPDGVGSLMWTRLPLKCRYTILAPVSRGAKGYVSREQICLEVPLDAGPYMTERTPIRVHFELSGRTLTAVADSVIVRDFELDLEQDAPASAAGHN